MRKNRKSILEENESEIDVSLAFSTDGRELHINLIAQEEMTPEEWSDLLFQIADKVASEGDEMIKESDSGSYHN